MTALSIEAVLPTTAAGGPPDPVLRLVPAPTSAPPYDDEIPDGEPVLRLVEQAQPVGVGSDSEDPVQVEQAAELWLAAARTPTAALPAARVFAHRLVQGVLEALAGVRPLRQLQRDLTPELFVVLQELAATPPEGAVHPGSRAVRSLHVQERPEGVAEVCATVARGARTGALALRLEGLDGRWRCTDLIGL